MSWPPGQAQVDFGQAEAIIAGVRMLLHLLVVTFPFSNTRFVQAYHGETAECVCHGLRQIFEHVGVAPRVLVPDYVPRNIIRLLWPVGLCGPDRRAPVVAGLVWPIRAT